MIERHKTSRGYVAGETHHSARYTDAQVEKVRELFASGMMQKDIAEAVGMCKGNVNSIIRGKSRARVTVKTIQSATSEDYPAISALIDEGFGACIISRRLNLSRTSVARAIWLIKALRERNIKE